MRSSLLSRMASHALAMVGLGHHAQANTENDLKKNASVEVETPKKKVVATTVAAPKTYSYADMVKRRKTRNKRLPKQQQVDIMEAAEAKRARRRARAQGASA